LERWSMSVRALLMSSWAKSCCELCMDWCSFILGVFEDYSRYLVKVGPAPVVESVVVMA
jgi:hypothetical protein